MNSSGPPAARESRRVAAHRRRRIIFNDDGGTPSVHLSYEGGGNDVGVLPTDTPGFITDEQSSSSLDDLEVR
jgi:hypothetical protein